MHVLKRKLLSLLKEGNNMSDADKVLSKELSNVRLVTLADKDRAAYPDKDKAHFPPLRRGMTMMQVKFSPRSWIGKMSGW